MKPVTSPQLLLTPCPLPTNVVRIPDFSLIAEGMSELGPQRHKETHQQCVSVYPRFQRRQRVWKHTMCTQTSAPMGLELECVGTDGVGRGTTVQKSRVR
ncbi:hypothetical protein TNCV_2817551 [Trichonephila clavipes]|nr:hypothetical protein TNCV_2817551 [Trichonephila clavipes]